MAKETLGKALYSAGQFENALAEFHKAYRIRSTPTYEEWIGRCEDTIKAFLTKTNIDFMIVEKLLDNEETKNWRKILTVTPAEEVSTTDIKLKKKPSKISKSQEIREKKEQKRAGLLMGKLHDDMMFLDKIANHPDLQKSLLSFGEEKRNQKDVDKVLKDIRGAALDGLEFLQVRKSFWEFSEPPLAKNSNKKHVRRSKSENSRQDNCLG